MDRSTSRMRSTSTMRATLRSVVRPRLSSAAQRSATAAFFDDFTATLPRSGCPPATRRWVGPVGPRLISSLSSATDSRPSSSSVRFWLPCSIRAMALWLVPRRSASCCWVRPRWRRASRTREPMPLALDSCARFSALDSCARFSALDSCARFSALSVAMSVSGTGTRYLACEITGWATRTAVHPMEVATSRRGSSGVCAPRPARQTATMDVLVTGATGRLGKQLTAPLQQAGHSVRQMSRRGAGPGGVRGDLATGRDLTTALAGAEAVVHAATDPRGDPWQVDVAGTRRLVEAVDRSRLRHVVYLSIVGVDRIPYGYYRAKFAAEQVLLASGLPVTLLRVTQYHHFVDFLLDSARRGPILPVPMGWRVQPVDVGDVAGPVARVG